MYKEEIMAAEDAGSKVVWFAAGIAIGATIGLLYAPASGEVTRRRIVRKTAEGRDALTESGKDMLERGREMYEKGRKLADDAAEMFERGRKIVESTAANLKG
jgi:gas vesicle protein